MAFSPDRIGRQPSDHRLLGIGKSTNEYIDCSDVIGIRAVVTTDTIKQLSSPTVLGHRSTSRTCSGSVLRIDSHKTNTVLLSQTRQPCYSLPNSPRCHRLTETLRPCRGLSSLDSPKVFNPKRPQRIPGKLLDRLVDVVLPCPGGTETTLTLGLSSPNSLTNGPDSKTVLGSIGINDQFVDPKVNPKSLAGLDGQVGQFNPEGSPRVSQDTTLEQFGPWFPKPVVKPLVPLERDHDRFPRGQSRDFENVIKGTLAGFNFGNKATEPDGSSDPGFLNHLTKNLGCFPGRNDCLQGNLEAVGAVTVREAPTGNPIESWGVQFTFSDPEGINVGLGAGLDLPSESLKTPELSCRGKRQGDFDCSLHLRDFLRGHFVLSGFVPVR